jgi:hypothetical protein
MLNEKQQAILGAYILIGVGLLIVMVVVWFVVRVR